MASLIHPVGHKPLRGNLRFGASAPVGGKWQMFKIAVHKFKAVMALEKKDCHVIMEFTREEAIVLHKFLGDALATDDIPATRIYIL